jgi:aromatic amino acid aminotransferase I
MAEVTADANGIVPDALEAMLSNWDVHTQGKKPKALYIIPTAQNPTGTTLSPERRMQVYAIAQKHDLIIFEDDPYWNVVFPNYPNFGKLNSLHSLDTDGRVIRFESFSKV